MTNLPTNPKKSEIIEQYWFEFLLFVKQRNEHKKQPEDKPNKPTSPTTQLRWEDVFWGWYVRFKLEPVEHTKPEQTQ